MRGKTTMKTALVTGVTGQDGSCLAELLLVIGDASLAERELGWKAEVLAPELAGLMVAADIQQLQDEQAGRLVRLDR